MGWGQACFGLAFLLPGPVQWKREGGSWAEALSMYIYIHSSAPGMGGSAESSANFPSGREDMKRMASASRGNSISPSQACGDQEGIAQRGRHQEQMGEPGGTSPCPRPAL